MKEMNKLDLLDISQWQDGFLERWLWTCAHSQQPQVSSGSAPIRQPDSVMFSCILCSCFHRTFKAALIYIEHCVPCPRQFCPKKKGGEQQGKVSSAI